MVKSPNWQETDQLAIYKRARRFELGYCGFQVQRPLTTRPCFFHALTWRITNSFSMQEYKL